jgi:hypothetical protein
LMPKFVANILGNIKLYDCSPKMPWILLYSCADSLGLQFTIFSE